ncbi:MAG: hypothetical protein R2738_11630 [Bacteroides graminisolvens]
MIRKQTAGAILNTQQGSKPADTNKDGIADSWATWNLPLRKTYKDIDKKADTATWNFTSTAWLPTL